MLLCVSWGSSTVVVDINKSSSNVFYLQLTGCFVAVRYYNEGASDFKETEVFKEAMEAQGFVESPSDSTIFDEPEPKDAPSPSQ